MFCDQDKKGNGRLWFVLAIIHRFYVQVELQDNHNDDDQKFRYFLTLAL